MSRSYVSHFGNESLYSIGLAILTANHYIQFPTSQYGSSLHVDALDNTKAVITDCHTNKWFLDSQLRMDYRARHGSECMMLGSICGDIAGSIYEHDNVKHCIDPKELIAPDAKFTDDSVMTVAVASGISKAFSQLPSDWIGNPQNEDLISFEIQTALLKYGRAYPDAGYGSDFHHWLSSDSPKPYNSWENDSAMRASYAGWTAQTLEEAERLGELSAAVTHNHPEGIKGARAVSGGIFVLRSGTIEDFRRYIHENYYDIDFCLDDIRDTYTFDVSCQGTIPQAIVAFLEGENFSDVISKAISIGGDSDTIAAIAASFAEVVYLIPEEVRKPVIDRLTPQLRYELMDAIDQLKYVA